MGFHTHCSALSQQQLKQIGSVSMSVHLPFCLFIQLSAVVHLCVCSFVCIHCLYVCRPSVLLCACPFVCIFACCLSVCSSVCLHVCLMLLLMLLMCFQVSSACRWGQPRQPSVCVCVCVCFCPSVCLSVCLCLSVTVCGAAVLVDEDDLSTVVDILRFCFLAHILSVCFFICLCVTVFVCCCVQGSRAFRWRWPVLSGRHFTFLLSSPHLVSPASSQILLAHIFQLAAGDHSDYATDH